MSWVCPTYGRPERLSELAESWVKCGEGKLNVRIWDQDPKRDEYYQRDWPEDWVLYVSPKEWCGEALHEFWEKNPGEKSYGFIADDIVLQTEGGLSRLESLAEDWFIAYPNDCIQKYRLCTHFCVGGELTRLLNYWTLPQLRHSLIDLQLMRLGIETRLLRYAPDVIFRHNHFLIGYDRDDTYKKVYGEYMLRPVNPEEEEAANNLNAYLEHGLQNDINKIALKFEEFEDVQQS